MNNYVKYTHGETGIVLGVMADRDKSGEVDIKGVFLEKKNILPLISDDLVIDIQLFLENYLDFID